MKTRLPSSHARHPIPDIDYPTNGFDHSLYNVNAPAQATPALREVPPQAISSQNQIASSSKNHQLWRAFGYAFAGLAHLFQTQRNARIHALIGACVLSLGWVLRIERWEWLALVLTCSLVIAAEGMNTAVEAAVDVATSTYHPLARIAKDVAAGTVLLCAIVSVIMGCIIFIPHLWPILISFMEAF